MGSEVWVFKCTKLTAKTKKQRLKIYSRGWIFKNTILKKRSRRKKEERKKKEREKKKELFKKKNHQPPSKDYIWYLP